MSSVQAWELLGDAEHCRNLTMEEFRKLLVRAGHSPEVVRRAAMEHGWGRLSAGESV